MAEIIDPEKAFKFVWALAIIVFCMLVIGIFLLLIKVLLIFYPDIIIMGIHFSQAT